MSSDTRTELLDRVRMLDDINAVRVLEFVKELSKPKPLATYEGWRKLAGTIRPEVLDQMERAIKEEFGQVDSNDWK